MTLNDLQKKKYREFLTGLVAEENDAASIGCAQCALDGLSDVLVPQILFRYRTPSEYSFVDLENGTITFSHPKEFDDRQDSLPSFSWDTFNQAMNSIRGKDAFKQAVKALDLEALPFDSDISSKSVTTDLNLMLDQINSLDKAEFDSVLESNQTLLRTWLESCVIPAHQQSCKNCCRILCLTSTPTNAKMWKEYAANGSGFVLVYDRESIRKCDNGRRVELLPVLYDDEPFDSDKHVEYLVARLIGLNVCSDDLLSNLRSIYRKGRKFEWEKEYRARIVPQKDEFEADFVSRPCKARQIIAGSNMSHDDKERCLTASKKLGIPFISSSEFVDINNIS